MNSQRSCKSNPCPISGKSPDVVDVLVRVQNTSIMYYNIVDDLHKMKVTLLIMKVIKIPQQKKIILKI